MNLSISVNLCMLHKIHGWKLPLLKLRFYYKSLKVRNVQTRTIVFDIDLKNNGALTILGLGSAKDGAKY